jgi:type IV pilus assembly protein PilW
MNVPRQAPLRQRGVTLVELLVTLAIGSLLIIGAVTIYGQSKVSYNTNESVARLQENARFALAMLEPDLRMASFWGLTSRSFLVEGRAAPTDPVPAGLAVGGDCGINWSINLARDVDGSNNGYAWGCAPFGGGPASATSDTLVIRRATVDPVAPAAGRLQVQTTRSQGALFADGAIPAGFAAGLSDTRDLVVHGYYVSTASALGANVPSLRRKRLVAGPSIIDEEIAPGVEDLQVQFGVDTSPPGDPDRGNVNVYVNPGDPIITPGSAAFNADAEIIAVRLWLRMVSERPEGGTPDNQVYQYADQNVAVPADGRRRLLVSKTIYLRNTRVGV